jgi:hypothetical protein
MLHNFGKPLKENMADHCYKLFIRLLLEAHMHDRLPRRATTQSINDMMKKFVEKLE